MQTEIKRSLPDRDITALYRTCPYQRPTHVKDTSKLNPDWGISRNLQWNDSYHLNKNRVLQIYSG